MHRFSFSNGVKNTRYMGIINISPDSFYEKSRCFSIEDVMKLAEKMVNDGADFLDLGAESSRPGSKPISEQEELGKLIPVISYLIKRIDIPISVDTYKPIVVEESLLAGAKIINDITGIQKYQEMAEVISRHKDGVIVMHMQGTPETMQNNQTYKDVVSEVLCFLRVRSEECQKAGIDKDNIIIDPGIGFGKTSEHNLTLLNNLNIFVNSGYSVLLGASRKRFMGEICDVERPNELVGATTATTVLGVLAGVEIFRVHDVKPNRQAADTIWSIVGG